MRLSKVPKFSTYTAYGVYPGCWQEWFSWRLPDKVPKIMQVACTASVARTGFLQRCEEQHTAEALHGC